MNVTHKVQQYYQPTNHSCGHSALAMLLSHYGRNDTPEDVIAAVPVNKDEAGKDTGSISQELATWTIKQGYSVSMYSFDFQIVDLSWSKLDTAQLLERLEAVKEVRNVAPLGKDFSERYVQSYIDFIEAGGELKVRQCPTSKLLHDLLQGGPLFANVATYPLYNTGRSSYPSVKVAEPDDVNGHIGTHSIVVYGIDDQGNFLIADPWSGPQTAEPEVLVCAITAAQIECDNLLFGITYGSAS